MAGVCVCEREILVDVNFARFHFLFASSHSWHLPYV